LIVIGMCIVIICGLRAGGGTGHEQGASASSAGNAGGISHGRRCRLG
jgi:hypothetical protein